MLDLKIKTRKKNHKSHNGRSQNFRPHFCKGHPGFFYLPPTPLRYRWQIHKKVPYLTTVMELSQVTQVIDSCIMGIIPDAV